MYNQEFYSATKITSLELPLKKSENFVFLHLFEGEIQLSIDEKSFDLFSGDSVFVLPDENFSVMTYEKSSVLVVEFSRLYIDDFYNKIASKQAIIPVFRAVNAKLLPDAFSDNVFLQKSLIYHLAFNFLSSCPLEQKDNKGREFIQKAISYIEDNYAKDINLHSLANFYGYNYNYMSSLFNETFKTSFNYVVNSYRLTEAKKLIVQNDCSLTEIAFTCGFKSIRSFNRNFLDYFVMSPSEFAAKEKK